MKGKNKAEERNWEREIERDKDSDIIMYQAQNLLFLYGLFHRAV